MRSEKKELTLVPGTNPTEVAATLVSLVDDPRVKEVMNRLDPSDAARIVVSAPGIKAQTQLLWSLEKQQRAAVVDHLAPLTIAALIQNLERRNRRLLGDIPLEHFSHILDFCSPKQRYYWMSLANSFADVGANLLVLLLPPEQVAEALLTVPEFHRKRFRLRGWMVDGFENEPPVHDPRLRAMLARLAAYDTDRYREVLELALEMAERAEQHAEMSAEFEAEPVVLPQIPEVPPLVPARAGVPAAAGADSAAPLRSFLPMPIPLTRDTLMRAAAGLLTPARRLALEQEMERAFRDEVQSDGGSLAMGDLEAAASRLQAYIRLGLKGVPEQPERVAEILEKVTLSDIVQRGTVALEQLRQIALRLRPFEALLDMRQRDLLQALLHLQPTTAPVTGAPALRVAASDRRRRAEAIPVHTIQERLAEVSVWVAISRAIGLRALTEKLAAAPDGSLSVLAALAVSLLLYERWDPQALESQALRQFRDRCFDREKGRWQPGTEEAVRQAVTTWATAARVESTMRPRVIRSVLEALARLEEFLRTHRAVAWDRFAPGKRPSHRKPDTESLEEQMADEGWQ